MVSGTIHLKSIICLSPQLFSVLFNLSFLFFVLPFYFFKICPHFPPSFFIFCKFFPHISSSLFLFSSFSSTFSCFNFFPFFLASSQISRWKVSERGDCVHSGTHSNNIEITTRYCWHNTQITGTYLLSLKELTLVPQRGLVTTSLHDFLTTCWATEGFQVMYSILTL